MPLYGKCQCFVMHMFIGIGKAANAAAIVYAFPWMGPKSTTSFILIVRSFTFRLNHDIRGIIYLCTDAMLNHRFYQA